MTSLIHIIAIFVQWNTGFAVALVARITVALSYVVFSSTCCILTAPVIRIADKLIILAVAFFCAIPVDVSVIILLQKEKSGMSFKGVLCTAEISLNTNKARMQLLSN